MMNICDYCCIRPSSLIINCSKCYSSKSIMICFKCSINVHQFHEHCKQHSFSTYQLIDIPLDDRLDDNGWSSENEIHFIEAIESCGLGNWIDLSTKLSRSIELCQNHFENLYLSTLKSPFSIYFQSFQIKKYLFGEKEINSNEKHFQSSSLIYPLMFINNEQQKCLTYMPNRDEYEREYLNEAEIHLPTQILNDEQQINEFEHDEQQQNQQDGSKKLINQAKLTLLRSYAQILRRRFQLKHFIRDYALGFSYSNDRELNLHQISRFLSADQYERLIFNHRKIEQILNELGCETSNHNQLFNSNDNDDDHHSKNGSIENNKHRANDEQNSKKRFDRMNNQKKSSNHRRFSRSNRSTSNLIDENNDDHHSSTTEKSNLSFSSIHQNSKKKIKLRCRSIRHVSSSSSSSSSTLSTSNSSSSKLSQNLSLNTSISTPLSSTPSSSSSSSTTIAPELSTPTNREKISNQRRSRSNSTSSSLNSSSRTSSLSRSSSKISSNSQESSSISLSTSNESISLLPNEQQKRKSRKIFQSKEPIYKRRRISQTEQTLLSEKMKLSSGNLLTTSDVSWDSTINEQNLKQTNIDQSMIDYSEYSLNEDSSAVSSRTRSHTPPHHQQKQSDRRSRIKSNGKTSRNSQNGCSSSKIDHFDPNYQSTKKTNRMLTRHQLIIQQSSKTKIQRRKILSNEIQE